MSIPLGSVLAGRRGRVLPPYHTAGVWPSHSKPQQDTESAAMLADKQLLPLLPGRVAPPFSSAITWHMCMDVCASTPSSS